MSTQKSNSTEQAEKAQPTGACFEVLVSLQKDVLDTEARAIEQSFQRLAAGASLRAVRVSRRYVLDFGSCPEDKARELAETLAREHLCNSVAEQYSVQRL